MIKEWLHRDSQVDQIASRLNLTKSTVSSILTGYVNYLRSRLDEGNTIKFLNVCYIVVDGKSEELRETLAYTASKVADTVGVDRVVAYRVLSAFEEYLVKDLRNFYGYNVRGLFSAKLQNFGKGYGYRLRLMKSSAYVGSNVHITALNSFKRKVEMP